METPAELGWRTVTLAVIAASTRCYHVVPGVVTTPASREYVVDRLSGATAVRATPAVAGEHRAAGQTDVRAVRDADVAGQADDRRYRETVAHAVQDADAVGHAD